MYGSLALQPKLSSRGGRWPSVMTTDGRTVRGVYDYSNASRAGFGVVVYYALPPGVYKVKDTISWKHDRKYYIAVHDSGEIEEISEEQALSWNQRS